MKIRYVTLTGADDRTDPSKLVELSEKFSFAEWAILFSPSKQGVSRYPKPEWVELFLRCCAGRSMNLSAHLCGKWVDDACKGSLTFFHKYELWDFGRIQFNMSRDRLAKVLNCNTQIFECQWESRGTGIIFGGPYQKYNLPIPTDQFMSCGIAPLFDCSGGRGIETKNWPSPPLNEYGKPLFCGYAGGLGPDNIEEQLQKIGSVAGDAEIWIDMETSLRDPNDQFDLEKCERVLSIVEPYITKS